TFARILVNPNYLQESSQAAEKQKDIYKDAYRLFEMKDYKRADSVLRIATALGETSFTPNLELLRILLLAETDGITRYQYELDQFVTRYAESDLAAYAKKLLETSRQFEVALEKRRGIQYIEYFDQPHYFVVVYPNTAQLAEKVTNALESFNRATFTHLNLKTSNLTLSDDYN